MERRGLVALFLTLVSVNFVSAAFSITDEFSNVDPSTMVLGFLFVTFAFLIHTGLTRTGPFRYNRTAAGMISISLSMLIIYGIDRVGWDYYSFFNGLAFFVPEEFIEIFWPFLFLILLVGSLWKLKKHALLFWGIFLIGLSFFAYESEFLAYLGGFLILLWLLLLLKSWLSGKKKPKLGGDDDPPEDYSNPPPGPRGEQGTPGKRGKQGLPGKSPISSSSPRDYSRLKNVFGTAKGLGAAGLGKAKQAGSWGWGKTKQAGGGIKSGAGWFGGKTKQAGGWAGNKWQQRRDAKAQKAAGKQQKANEQAAGDQAKRQKIEQKQQLQIETQQAQEQRAQQKAQEQAQEEQKKAGTEIEKLEKRLSRVIAIKVKEESKGGSNTSRSMKLEKEVLRIRKELQRLRNQ